MEVALQVAVPPSVPLVMQLVASSVSSAHVARALQSLPAPWKHATATPDPSQVIAHVGCTGTPHAMSPAQACAQSCWSLVPPVDPPVPAVGLARRTTAPSV